MPVRLRSVFVIVVLSAASLVGCGRAQQAPDSVRLSAAEFVAQGTGQDGVVIDVRTPAEYEAGHLVGALNIDLRSSTFREQVQALESDKTYYLYCRTGNRSGQAAAIMREQGLDVRNVGGLSALQAAGAAVQAGR